MAPMDQPQSNRGSDKYSTSFTLFFPSPYFSLKMRLIFPNNRQANKGSTTPDTSTRLDASAPVWGVPNRFNLIDKNVCCKALPIDKLAGTTIISKESVENVYGRSSFRPKGKISPNERAFISGLYEIFSFVALRSKWRSILNVAGHLP